MKGWWEKEDDRSMEKRKLLRKGGKADSDLLCSAIPGLHQLIEHVTLLRLIVMMMRFNMMMMTSRMVVMTMMVIVMMMRFNMTRMITVMILMVPHIILKGGVCYLLVAAGADRCQGRVEILGYMFNFRVLIFHFQLLLEYSDSPV